MSIDGFSSHWGQWMLSITWQLGLLVVVLSALTWLCRRKSAVFLHALWLLVLVRLVLPPAFAFPTGWAWWLRSSESQVAEADKEVGGADGAPNSQPAEPSVGPARQHTKDATGQGQTMDAEASKASAPSPRSTTTAPQTGQPADTSPVVDEPPMASFPGRWSMILMIGWASVSLTIIGMLVRGQWLTWQWVRRAKPNTADRFQEIMARCCRRLGLKRAIAIRDSEACSTPLVVGLIRPTVLLPSSVAKQLSDQELEAVLTHELAHVVRHDALVNLFQGILSAIYFFNPLVWWANYQIHRLREEACDELTVTALNGRRKAYGAAIIKVTETLGYAPSPLALGIMEVKHSAKRRLSRILDPDLPRGHGLRGSALVVVVLVGAVFLPSGAKPSAASIANTIAFLTGSSRPLDEGDDLSSETSGDEQHAVTDQAAESTRVSPNKAVTAAKNQANDKKASKTAQPKAKTAAVDHQKTDTEAKPKVTGKVIKRGRAWRYQWQRHKSIHYDVKIEAEDAVSTVSYLGNASLQIVKNTDGQVTIRFMHHLQDHRRYKNPADRLRHEGLGVPLGGFFRGLRPRAAHQLTVDDHGELLSVLSDSALPYYLGNLSQICVLAFPRDGRSNWTVKRQANIEARTSNPSFPRRRLFPDASKTRSYAARFDSSYTTKIDGDDVLVSQQHRMVTRERTKNAPAVELAGTGTWRFDHRRGLIRRVELEYRLTDRRQGQGEAAIVRLTVNEVNPVEYKRRQREARKRQRAPLAQAKSDKAAADLASGERRRILSALVALRFANPNQDRAAIVALVLPHLKSKDKVVRRAAHHAALKWYDNQNGNVKLLAQLLQEDDAILRWSIIDALSKIRSVESAQVLVRRLTDKGTRTKAADALIKIGSLGETVVARQLSSGNEDVRLAVLRVLAKVGTKKTLPAVQRVIKNDPSPSVRLKALATASAMKKK